LAIANCRASECVETVSLTARAEFATCSIFCARPEQGFPEAKLGRNIYILGTYFLGCRCTKTKMI
jgi:hypothetical protein